MVRANLGFALLPEYVKAILPERVVARPLDWHPPLSLTVLMIHRADDLGAVLTTEVCVVLGVMGQSVARRNASMKGKT